MDRQNILSRRFVSTALAVGLVWPAKAQSTHEQRVMLVRDEAQYLAQTGRMLNWNLEDYMRVWARVGYRDIPDADLDIFEREIARERRLRGQQADQDREWQEFLIRREQNQGQHRLSDNSLNFPLSMPPQPAPPK